MEQVVFPSIAKEKGGIGKQVGIKKREHLSESLGVQYENF